MKSFLRKSIYGKMNKRGYSFSGWAEGIILSLLFIVILAGVIGYFNIDYGKNNQIGLGTNTTELAFKDYEKLGQTNIQEGEASFTSASGMTLGTSWTILKGLWNVIISFLTGGWIESLTNMMHLPVAVGIFFRILYIGTLIFILIRILFKVNP